MPVIEHRKILEGSEGSKLMTLPKGHTIMKNSTEIKLIISNNLIVVSDTKVSLDKIKSELQGLVENLA